jgi:hypothetical protein
MCEVKPSLSISWMYARTLLLRAQRTFLLLFELLSPLTGGDKSARVLTTRRSSQPCSSGVCLCFGVSARPLRPTLLVRSLEARIRSSLQLVVLAEQPQRAVVYKSCSQGQRQRQRQRQRDRETGAESTCAAPRPCFELLAVGTVESVCVSEPRDVVVHREEVALLIRQVGGAGMQQPCTPRRLLGFVCGNKLKDSEMGRCVRHNHRYES